MSLRHPNSVQTRQPLLYAALAFAAGIVFGHYAWRPPLWWLVATLVFLSSTAYFLRRRLYLSVALVLGALFWLGAFSIQLRAPAPDVDTSKWTDGNEVVITAHVLREGNFREAGFGGVRQTLDVETEQVTTESNTVAVVFGLRVTLYGKVSRQEYDLQDNSISAMRLYRYGERLRFTAKLHPGRNYRNPGAFDFRDYLAEQGVVALGSGKAADVEVLAGFAGNRLESWRSCIHRSVMEKVHALWPPAEAALMDAMVIGEDAFITRDSRADFQRSGTYHILVVSGLNVGILAFVVFWTLRRLRVSEIAASVLVVLISVAYAFLTDVGPPIWRATLMLMLYLGVRLLYRDRSMLNAIGGAALGLLIIDPRALLGASFQLTFLSVLIIGAIGIPILERTSAPYRRGLRYPESTGYDQVLPPRVAQFRLELRMIADRLARFIGKRVPLAFLVLISRIILIVYETLLISALMQIGLALPMAWYFHRATVMGLPANVLVIPLTGVLMPAAVLAVAVSYVSNALAKIPALIAGIALEGITGTVRWVGGFRVADWRVATPEVWVLFVAALALGLAMILARRRPWLACAGLAPLCAVASWIAAIPPEAQLHPGVLEFTAIHVGQADSTLLVTPEGRTLLIDAGGPLGGMRSDYDIGEEVVSPFLWSRGISRLDAVVLTHCHSDHIGGMRAVLANFRPRELWLGPNPPTPAFLNLVAQAKSQNIRVLQHGAGDTFEFGGIHVRVLSPPQDWQVANQPRNNDSLALQFVYGETAVLAEADAEKKMERLIADQQPRSDLLKVAHNGSMTSTIPELLAAVRPRSAVISVGAYNSFGHPRKEILERLGNAGVSVYRTDLDGAVTFYLDGHTISPSAPR